MELLLYIGVVLMLIICAYSVFLTIRDKESKDECQHEWGRWVPSIITQKRQCQKGGWSQKKEL